MERNFAKVVRAGVSVACLTGAVGAAFAAPMIDLNGVGYVLYGDGESYSLPGAIIDKCGGVASGCMYSVDSTPGAIKDLVVVATGTESGPATKNVAGMDDAYSTPSGVSGSIFFRPDPTTDRGSTGTIKNNYDDTWDASLAAMKTFLGGNQLVTFFNNNQTNSGGKATESLAAWGQVWLTDASNVIVGDVFQFTNRNKPYKLFTEGGGGIPLGDPTTYTNTVVGNPIAGTNAATDYVLSGGAICRIGVLPVPCDTPGASAPIQHNLGADHAAYAILFPELNARLDSLFASKTDAELADYTLHIDVRLGCDPSITDIAGVCTGNDPTVPYGRSLNNGYEQIFIGTATPRTTVPEPGTMALAGFALAALGWITGRRRVVI